jgi:light-harvesting complex II chlorophyll a/b binding protein 4
VARPAEWNPLNLEVPGVPVLGSQFVPEYLKTGPTYLDGSLPGDIGFDPWGLTVLAGLPLNADGLQAVDKSSRTAEQRNERMLSLSPAEQQEKVMWMRSSELKHGRLAMLAAAGWPLAEMLNGDALRLQENFTNGRAPSLFNGHLLDYFPFLLVAGGGLVALEMMTKDTVKDGDYGFDPLGFSNNGGMETLKLAEIKHGRAAMMGITGFAVQEFAYGTPVVEQTPFFFLPFGGIGAA